MGKGRILFFCFLFVSGCRVHDVIDCNLPPVEIPCVYLNDKEGVMHDDEWWKEFHSEELNLLVECALKKNLDLQEAWYRLYQAYAEATIAGSERFPQVDISNQFRHTDFESSGSAPPLPLTGGGGGGSLFSGGQGSENRYVLTPILRYEVDIWRRICSQFRSAEREAFATYEEVRAAALLLTGSLTDVWLTIQEQIALLKVLHHQIEVSKTLLELVELRFTVGESSALDVYQQRLQLASTEAAVPPVRSLLETSTNQLYTFLAEPPRGLMDHDATDILEALPPFPDLGSPMDLVYRRPDLRAEYQRLISADYAVASAIADRFPKLTLNLSYQFSTTTLKELFQQEFFSLIVELLTPVIDGGRRRAEVYKRKAIVCQRLNSFAQSFLEALEEVESAVVVEKYQIELLEKVNEQIELATVNLEEARIHYAYGQNDYLTVIAAVQSLQSLERERVSVRKGLMANRALLYRALGGFCL